MVKGQKEEYGSLWAAVSPIAEKIVCTPKTFHLWVTQSAIDAGLKLGITTDERARLKELERENRELKKANEILRLASAFFAQVTLDRKLK